MCTARPFLSAGDLVFFVGVDVHLAVEVFAGGEHQQAFAGAVGGDVGLCFQGDCDVACGADVGFGRIAGVACGDAQVFRRAAEADIEFAVVRVNCGQAFAEIGVDGDACVFQLETPRLGVVTGGRLARGFDERVVGCMVCSSVEMCLFSGCYVVWQRRCR